MFRKLIKNKKAQNTAEYAILISLVVAGIIAMQTYAQRALQARVRDASVYLANKTGIQGMGNTLQYEPYYLDSNYTVKRDEVEAQFLDNVTTRTLTDTKTTRRSGGSSKSKFDNTSFGASGF
jgi:uncharacterized protein (UPF0333 family)